MEMAPVIFLRSSFLLLWRWIKPISFANVEPNLRTTHYKISVDHKITFWNIWILYFIFSYSQNFVIRRYSVIFLLFYVSDIWAECSYKWEGYCWWRIFLIKGIPNEGYSWWRRFLIKGIPDEGYYWWRIFLEKDIPDEGYS